MGFEKALYLPFLRAISQDEAGEFSRVYIGAEFCDKLLPTQEELKEFLKSLPKGVIKGITFLTPPIPEEGMMRLKKIFQLLSEYKAECVVNDVGVLRLLKNFSYITPVLGRTFWRVLRDPRDSFKKFRLLKMNSYFMEMLEEYNIHRLEIDVLPGPKEKIPVSLKKFRFSFYYPYTFVSTSRFCLTLCFRYKSTIRRVRKCDIECKLGGYEFHHKTMSFPLILRGNTLYLLQRNHFYIPVNFFIDRIVYQLF